MAAVERSLIVIQKLPDHELRTGALLEKKKGGLLRVRWHDDGREEDVKISATTTFAPLGSLRYQSFVDPDVLRASWEKDPLSLISQLLRERRTAMNARQIKDQLRILGLAPESVDAEWKRVQSKLAKLDDVEVKGTKYSWVGGEDDTGPSSAAEGVPATSERPEPQKESEEEISRVEKAFEVVEAPPSEEVSSVVRMVATAIGTTPPADERAFLSRPLRTGVGLGGLTSREVERLLREATPQGSDLVRTLLLARPHKTSALEVRDIDPAAVVASIEAAITEIRGNDDDRLRAAATWLIRRAVAAEQMVTPGPVVELARLVAVDATQAELEALDDAVRDLGERLVGTMRPGADPDALARLVPQLPFKEGRTALIVAVAELWPERITDPTWWRGATAEGLAALSHGPMRRVLLRPEVAERVIAPLVARELASVSSRTRLARLLALPSEFAEHLAALDVVTAFRRAAVNDPYVSAWLEALESKNRVMALERRLEEAEARREEAVERGDRAEAQVADWAQRYAELERRLQAQHEHAAGLRASQERQLQIDAVRALAELAAEVEELAAANTAPDVVTERVRGLVSGQELEPIGDVGATVSFDRRLHEPLFGTPREGAAVSVVRPGYRWRADGEDVLLQRAVVSTE